METASLCHSRTQGIGSSLPNNKVIKQFPKSLHLRTCCQLRNVQSAYMSSQSHGLKSLKQRFGHVAATGCVASDSGLLAEFERELEAEMKPEEEEWIRAGRLRERCKERKGMVELLECLEAEAIMGEDQGREPTDYNRRAQIFDKSSRVFQALRARTQLPHLSQQS